MKTDQATRTETEALRGSGAAAERAQNAEPKRDWDRQKMERGGETNRERSSEEDLILHDDDEAEFDLPR